MSNTVELLGAQHCKRDTADFTVLDSFAFGCTSRNKNPSRHVFEYSSILLGPSNALSAPYKLVRSSPSKLSAKKRHPLNFSGSENMPLNFRTVVFQVEMNV